MQTAAPIHRAVIDVGSNSARLEIARWTGGRLVSLHRDRILTRLGSPGIDGRLDPQAVDRAIKAVVAFTGQAMQHDVASLRIVATAAVRQASDGDAFIAKVHEATGIELEVLTPEAEALAVLRSVRRADIEGSTVAVVDIGGASSELVIEGNGRVEHVASMPLGAVNLSSRFDSSGAIEPSTLEAMQRAVHRELEGLLPDPVPSVDTGVGVGGSFTTLARVFGGVDEPVEGFVLERSMVIELSDRLAGLDCEGRAGIRGIESSRAGIIVAGVSLVDQVMQSLGLHRMIVHEGGVARGVLLEQFMPG